MWIVVLPDRRDRKYSFTSLVVIHNSCYQYVKDLPLEQVKVKYKIKKPIKILYTTS